METVPKFPRYTHLTAKQYVGMLTFIFRSGEHFNLFCTSELWVWVGVARGLQKWAEVVVSDHFPTEEALECDGR